MPRNGQGVYSLPPVYEAVTGETIEAQQHNIPLEDIASDANNPRPITTGGTGGASAQQARDNFDVYNKSESVQAAKDAIGVLAAKETPVDADSVVIVDSADSNKPKKTLWSKIKALVNTASVGAAVAAANGKATPADGDFFAGVEAGGSTMFKSTWGNIKTALKALFDPLYLSINGGTLNGSLIIQGGVHSKNTATFGGIAQGKVYFRNNTDVTVAEIGVGTITGFGNTIGFYNSVGGNWQFNNELRSEGHIRAGNAVYATDGNVTGTVWSDWGELYAKQAINARIETRSYWRTQEFLANSTAGSVGSYALLYYTQSGSVGPGASNGGGAFSWSSAWGNSNIGAPTGSWRCMGYCDSNTQTARVTLHLRYA